MTDLTEIEEKRFISGKVGNTFRTIHKNSMMENIKNNQRFCVVPALEAIDGGN